MGAMLLHHASQIGLKELREDPQHNMLCGATATVTDDSVGKLAEPVGLILAQFGTQIPVGSKFKVS